MRECEGVGTIGVNERTELPIKLLMLLRFFAAASSSPRGALFSSSPLLDIAERGSFWIYPSFVLLASFVTHHFGQDEAKIGILITRSAIHDYTLFFEVVLSYFFANLLQQNPFGSPVVRAKKE